MNVEEHITRLQYLMEHGLNPKAEVQCWDPNMEEWLSVTGIVYGGSELTVRFYTDDP